MNVYVYIYPYRKEQSWIRLQQSENAYTRHCNTARHIRTREMHCTTDIVKDSRGLHRLFFSHVFLGEMTFEQNFFAERTALKRRK